MSEVNDTAPAEIRKSHAHNFIDLTGQTFGKWKVEGYVETDIRRKTIWSCRCDCGTVRNVYGSNLRNGLSTSCGCNGLENLVGRTFGDLTVIEFVRVVGKEISEWRCQCACGNTCVRKRNSLTSNDGRKHTCGCHKKNVASSRFTTHGGSTSRIYRVWAGMLTRCFNPNEECYKYYGGRGITVCDEWREDFATFRDWAMKNGYADDLTIERVRVNESYRPDNCTWIPQAEQMSNTRVNLLITAFGETKPCSKWVKDPRCSVSRETLKARVHAGWDHERAVSKPARKITYQ